MMINYDAVEGVDYTSKGIRELREWLIRYRDVRMRDWPDTIELTVNLTHVIVLLDYLASIQDFWENVVG